MADTNGNETSKYPKHDQLQSLLEDERAKHDSYWFVSRVDQKVAITDAEKDYWTRREGETWHDFEEAEARTGDFLRDNKEELAKEEEAMRREEQAKLDAENHAEVENSKHI